MLLRWISLRWRGMPPPALFAGSFALLIGLGTLGLKTLPGLYTGPELSGIDALFTATSAACVTGLVVVDTATHFTFWGQLWLLVLFQVGGLGLIGMTSLIIGAMGRRLSLRTEMIVVPALHESHGRELLGMILSITRFTLFIEAGCALALWLMFLPELGAQAAVWPAIFHAVSAFCNAGFSTFSDSLVGFAQDAGVLLVMSVTIIVGGFGYLSTTEIFRWSKAGGLRGPIRLSAHTYGALLVTVVLLFGATAIYALLEWDGVLAGHNPAGKLVNAWFMSTTVRTAGFNSVDYELLGNSSAYITILLMGIGGSPGSTAGGIKTTTVAILVAMAWSRMRGRRFVQLHDRKVPDGTVQRTVALVVVFSVLVLTAIMLLTIGETGGEDLDRSRRAALPLIFEAVSATGTVGLSMGMTAGLTSFSKTVMILAMFIGRVGPLAFFAAISIKSSRFPAGYRPAHEDVIVG